MVDQLTCDGGKLFPIDVIGRLPTTPHPAGKVPAR